MAREISTDVLVIGAGPAGCAAATILAGQGIDTLLVDRSESPREKVCGDGLIPDAMDALRTLGLEEEVCRRARMTDEVRVYAPRGSYVSLSGRCACISRKELDHLLLGGAARAGASFLAPYSARTLNRDPVGGAWLEHQKNGDPIKVSARTTVLATGAGVEGITSFDVAERRQPSAVALRAYFKVPSSLAKDIRHLTISYDASIAPGYGWIFPGPDDVFNIGVGHFLDSRRAAAKPALGDLWSAFTKTFAPVRDLLKVAEQVSPLRGAPLRTAMTGSRLFRPGLVVVGEAASLTYSFTGEGIGKAMASGIIAGELIADGLKGRLAVDDVGPAYGARLERDFAPRFRAYQAAQRWLEHPKLIDFVVWRAGRSAFVRETLEGVFGETANPRALLSVEGAARSVLPTRLMDHFFPRCASFE